VTSAPSEEDTPPGLRLRVLRRGVLIVVATGALVTAIAVGASLSQQKLYESSVDVFLAGGAADLPPGLADQGNSGPSNPERTSKTKANLARVPAIARRALDAAGVRNRSAGELLKSSTVSASPGADILKFTVTDPDRGLASRLATAYANAFASYRRELDTGAIIRARRDIEQRLRAIRKVDRKAQSRLYQDLAGEAQQLRTAQALRGSNAELVDSGHGASQIQPRPLRNAIIGLILGLVMGVALAFLRDALNTRVRAEDEIPKRLGLPLLGRVPRPPKVVRSKGGIVMLAKPQAPEADAYRVVATNLGFVNLDRGAKSIMVTSAIRGEGKSTTTANVAVALARSGVRVVVVDLDLKRPAQDRLFDLGGRGPGVTNVALGQADLAQAVVPVQLSDPFSSLEGSADGPAGRLGVLPTGPIPPDTAQFVSSPKVAAILSQLAESNDVVLVDAPAILEVSDAVALTGKVDAVLAVARLSMVRRPQLNELRRVLASAPVAKLGVVLTGATVGEGYGYGYGKATSNGARPERSTEPAR
jgi:succinoglycan biosynthesis transport protein ExoP